MQVIGGFTDRPLSCVSLTPCVPVLHCIVVLFQAATLNVAINSHNKALLTIMVSNQFVELKGSVFKKCAVDNLFQVSCSGELASQLACCVVAQNVRTELLN